MNEIRWPKWEETTLNLRNGYSRTICKVRVAYFHLRIANMSDGRWRVEVCGGPGYDFPRFGKDQGSKREAKREAIRMVAEHMEEQETKINEARKELLGLSDE